MEESRITFQGPGPFHLPVVQRATARPLESSVGVTLHVMLDERGLTALSFQIVPAQAQLLAAQLLNAVGDLERKHPS
jgi:hypothetical protein